MASKAELLAGLPPEPDEAALLPDIQRMVDAGGRKLVVIDDDPTGVQTVHDVALHLSWDQATLEDALRDPARLFFLLTNSRSLPGDEAARVNHETARMLAAASKRTGVEFVVASRSDSTLRGHYPAEILALQQGLGRAFDGHLLVPAFFEGGRLTFNDTHYVATPNAASDTLVPASDTPFAQDKVFGYTTARLPAWVEEKSGGAFRRDRVLSLSLELIRSGGPDAVARALMDARGGVPVVVNAAGYGDLAVVVLGVLRAEAAGKRFLYRTAAGFVRLRGAVEPRPLLTAADILGKRIHHEGHEGHEEPDQPEELEKLEAVGGLVVVGSHVPGSTAQLAKLLEMPGVAGVELRVARVIAGDESTLGRELGRRLEVIIESGRVGVLYTSRDLVTGQSDAENLKIGRRVSDALVAAVQAISIRPHFLIAKGGITSQVVAQNGLGATRSLALGQIVPGVPVWRLESGPSLRFPGMPYVVFPGNVGGPDSLAEVVRALRPRGSQAKRSLARPASSGYQLEQAAAFNHRELFRLSALAAGGEVQDREGVTWTDAGPEGEPMIAFPTLTDERAGAQLDEIVAYYLRHIPRHLVGCWSLEPPRPRDLGARLLARGFQPGWRPCWMALDLERVRADHPQPPGLVVRADSETSLQAVQDLPYAGPDAVALNLFRKYPDRARRFVAWLDGRVVGHSAVLFTSGPLGAAGIYDVGVVPEARNQGIGKAVVLAACLYARERGHRYAVLNATGRRMYEQLGFEWIGDGWTWWLNVPRLAAHLARAGDSAMRVEVELAEAVGRGDVLALDRLGATLDAGQLDTPLANEMTLMQLAVHLHQPTAAEWLVTHGAALDVLSAWDLGWRERAARLLADDPSLANRRYGEWKITLLHEAASRGDLALARLALSAKPDLSVQDTAFHSTPLGWARHFERAEIVRLIEEQLGE